eukprot:TRINITY_DN23912_c0_g1_i2.p1 TRINITY_DN23912_c0_g1~~TRINITY_DN23912_c0_g1_i2.p1  ORF type:complete len:189 (+),score=33.58 TRINITY_DN23912_c0_g1_i2:41-568(+)
MENPFSIVPSTDSSRVIKKDVARSGLVDRDSDLFNRELGFSTASAGFPCGGEIFPSEKTFPSERQLEGDGKGSGFGTDISIHSSHLTFRSHPADPPVDTQNERHCLLRNDVVAMRARDDRTPVVSDGDRRPEVLDDGEQRNNTKKKPYAARVLSAIICTISPLIKKKKNVQEAWT